MCHLPVIWAIRPYTYILTIAYLAKGQVIAQQVKGLVIALAIAQKHLHNLLHNLL